jgi:hypothetical protein
MVTLIYATQVEETSRAIRLTNHGLTAQAAAKQLSPAAPLTGPELLRRVLKAGAAGSTCVSAAEQSHPSPPSSRPLGSATTQHTGLQQQQQAGGEPQGQATRGEAAPREDPPSSALPAFKALGEVSLAAPRSSPLQDGGTGAGGSSPRAGPGSGGPQGPGSPPYQHQTDPLNPPLYQRIQAAYITPYTHSVAEYAAARANLQPDSSRNMLVATGPQSHVAPQHSSAHLPAPGLSLPQGGEALQGSVTTRVPATAPALLLAPASSPSYHPLTPPRSSNGRSSGARAQLHSRAKEARAQLLDQFVSPTVTLWPAVPGATVGDQGFTK